MKKHSNNLLKAYNKRTLHTENKNRIKQYLINNIIAILALLISIAAFIKSFFY